MDAAVHELLERYRRRSIEVSELKQVAFPNAKSRIILSSGGSVFCCVFAGLEGLFRKDQLAPRLYGRCVCDDVKQTFSCGGFFTSDELPRYGIHKAEIQQLYQTMHKTEGDGQLIVMFAYPQEMAQTIRSYLIARFQADLVPFYANSVAHTAPPTEEKEQTPTYDDI